MTESESRTYTLQEAAETLGVSAEDLESYVEEGLVTAQRTADASLVFTRAEMRRLWSVVTLHRDLGINLPGVAAVLQLRQQFEQVRRDLALLAEIVERELGQDAWDRLWPEGRPRPATNISVEEVSNLPGEERAVPPNQTDEEPPAGRGEAEP